jgi:alkylated DNA repair dioxygenase AlkB
MANFAGLPEHELVEAILTEYSPGAPIGWHRDVAQFDVVIGVSLAASCRMRLKPYKADGKILSVILEPRSAYIMRGAVRWNFQHSISPVSQLRYSITFRSLRNQQSRRDVA